MAATFVPIQSVTLASSAASVTFSSIPQTYTDLVLKISCRTTASANGGTLVIQLNSDTASNYSYTRLYANGASSYSDFGGGQPTGARIGFTTAANSTSNTFASSEIYLPNYASTTARPISGFSVPENNATNVYYTSVYASLYRGTSAATSLTILEDAGQSFVAGTTFHLYGIKNS